MENSRSFLKLIRNLSLISILVFSSFAVVNAQADNNNCFRFGYNLGMPRYYGSGGMFINIFTSCSGWSNMGTLVADTSGYPIEIPYAGVTESRTIISSGKNLIVGDTVYVLRWDGDGDLDFTLWGQGSTVLTEHSRTSNRIEFSINYGPESGPGFDFQVILRMTRSQWGDHVHNVRLYLKSFEDLYENQGERFNPRWLEKIAPFQTIRFMPAFNTNGGNNFVDWSDRTTKSWYNQASGNFGAGLAYEWACDLCNLTQQHMWFNVPHQANDEAIRKMAELVYEQLDPDLDIYLEYSNEVWNWAPAYWPQSNYAQIHGQLYFGGGIQEGYADLCKNMFRIWREVFKQDSLRVKRVCAVQTISDLNHNAIPRINAMGPENFDVFSPTYYFPGMKTSYCDENDAMDDMLASIRGGAWYQSRKANADLANAYGKEVFCYEGGMGADPLDAGDYNCLSVVQALQTNPLMEDVLTEAIDSLVSMGMEGGNELSIFGGWGVNAVNNLVSFWGTIPSYNEDPAGYPKYLAYTNNVQDCDNLTMETDTVGSGLAFRFDGVNDYVDASIIYKPNDISNSYTIEAWVRPEKLGFDQSLWSLSYGTDDASNNLYLAESNRFVWEIKNNSGAAIASLQGPIISLNNWVHVAAVKSGNTYTLYINGSEKASAQGNLTGDCTRSRFVIGGKVHAADVSDNFCGKIDEFRVWNTALTNLTTLRNAMCRKVDATHPKFANLQAYYRFDEASNLGVVADQYGAFDINLQNVKYSKYSNYQPSGAPIGDNSVQTYPPAWSGVSLTYYHPNGDRLTVSGLGDGNPEGVHIYLVDQEPTVNTPPSDLYSKTGSYYYGVFVANGTDPHYSTIFNYVGNPDAAIVDESNRLLKRESNADKDGWQNTGGILDVYAKSITTRIKRESKRAEYFIGNRQNLVKDLAGPGYALLFNDSATAVIDYERPDDEYTVSLWYKTNNPFSSQGALVTFRGVGYANYSQLYYSSLGDLTFTADKYWDNAQQRASRIIDNSGWNHMVITKKDDFVKVYMNGKQRLGPILMGYNSNGVKRDVGFSQIELGGSYQGWIDEFQVWDIALDSTTIRDWMCREVTDKHPYEAEHLLLYYKFDEGLSSELENTRGPGDMMLTNTSWEPSGCPVGDTSVYIYNYTQTDNYTLSISHRDGDTLEVEKTGGENYGMHLYRVDGKAQFSTIPGAINSYDSTRYWGVYPISVGYTGARKHTYDVRYYYNGNSNVDMGEENNLQFLDRTNNREPDWHLNLDVPNLTSHYFQESYVTADTTNLFWHPYVNEPHEFMLGATTSTAIVVDTARPPQPGPISGKNPVCSGETALTYAVAPSSDPDVFYVWTLPPGLSGFSDSSSIIINVSPTADGLLGDLEVAAVNKNGVGPARTLAITADLTPSLTVNITGSAEICSDATETYSIPDVGAISYNWDIPSDASIVADNNTSIDVDFGSVSDNISVYGNFSCGTSLINTKPITVNNDPDINLGVTGNRICLGEIEYGLVTVSNSELGVNYQLYKNGGTAPVGDNVYGTGFNLVMEIPINQLLAGDNVITVKAQMGNCPEVTLVNTAMVTVDVPPDPDMSLYALQDTICKGQPGIIIAPNSPAGLHFLPVNDYDQLVDAYPPYDVNPGTISPGGYTEISVKPCDYNGQHSNVGIAMGPNRVTFKATIGSCKTVDLNSEIDIFVKDDPRTHNYQDAGLQWWVNGGNVAPWPVIPDFDAEWINVVAPASICNTDFEWITVEHAQLGVSYVAVRDYDGLVLTDTVTCTFEGANLNLAVLPGVFPAGNDQDVIIRAIGSGCDVQLSKKTIDVIEGPDVTKEVIGSAVCSGDDGTIQVLSSQNGINYRAYTVLGDVPVGSTVVGDGNDITITIPTADLSLGANLFKIRAQVTGCSALFLEDTATVNEIVTLDNGPSLTAVYPTVCGGTDGVMRITGAQEGVYYQAYADGTAIGVLTQALGDTLEIILPDAELQVPAYQDQTINITVEVSAGSCGTVFLSDNVNIDVNSLAYPTGDLYTFERDRICPLLWVDDTLWLDVGQNVYGVGIVDYIGAIVEGAEVGIKTPPTSTNQYTRLPIGIDRKFMPEGGNYDVSFYAYINGCPPMEVTGITGYMGNTVPVVARVADDFHFESIGTDTVCVGDIAEIIVYNPDTNYNNIYYQIYDEANDKVVSLSYSTVWDAWDYPQYLPSQEHNMTMDITNPDDLHVGVNHFVLRGDMYGNNNCPWQIIPNSDLYIVVNDYPLTDMPMIGNSVCNADGVVEIDNTEPDVVYEAFMGTQSVGSPVQGTGGTISIVIPAADLSDGANNITLKATRNACATVNLDNVAIIEKTSSPPAKPSVITGDAEICPNETGIQYSVDLDNQASSYTWTLPSGATTLSTSNIALVDFTTTGGNITVAANNICGAGTPSDPFPVTVHPTVAGGTIAGATSLCNGGSTDLTLVGHSGDIVYWEYAEYVNLWLEKPSETSTTLSTGPLTRPTDFRVKVEVADCGSVYSTIATVFVDTIPIGNSGIDSTIHACEGDNSFDIFLYMGGTPDVGGTWTDDNATGALTGSVLDVTQLTPGSIYDYTYTQSVVGCLPSESTTTIIVDYEPDAGLPNTDTICSNTALHDLFTSLAGTPAPGGSWTDDDATGALTGANMDMFDPTGMTPGDYDFTYSVSSLTCPGSNSTTITLHVIEGPMSFVTDNVTTCMGTDAVLNVQGSQVGVEYSILDDMGVAVTSVIVGDGNPLSFTVPASSFVEGDNTFTVQADNGSCVIPMLTQPVISVDSLPVSEILTVDDVVCPFDTGKYNVVEVLGNTYLWRATNGAVIGDSTTTDVVVEWFDSDSAFITVYEKDVNGTGCTGNTPLAIDVSYNSNLDLVRCNDNVTVEAVYNPQTEAIDYVVTDNSIDVYANDDCGIKSIVNDYNNKETLIGEVIPSEQTINWTVTDYDDRTTSCALNVQFSINDEIDPPRAFSPNADGINDTWEIELLSLKYPDAIVKIFDKSGRKVFESEPGYPVPWDGVHNGKVLGVDSYYAVIKMDEDNVMKVIVTIIK